MHSVSSTDTTSSTSGSGCGTLQEQQYNIPTPTNTSKYILLVSGLQVGNPTTTGPTTGKQRGLILLVLCYIVSFFSLYCYYC